MVKKKTLTEVYIHLKTLGGEACPPRQLHVDAALGKTTAKKKKKKKERKEAAETTEEKRSLETFACYPVDLVKEATKKKNKKFDWRRTSGCEPLLL